MNKNIPLTLGRAYELVSTCSKDWPICVIVDGRFMWFNGLEELELDRETLRLHFQHATIEFWHVKRQWWKFIGMYGEEEPVE